MSREHAERAERLLLNGRAHDTEKAQVLALLHIGDAINRLAEAVTTGRRAPIPVKPTWRDVSS